MFILVVNAILCIVGFFFIFYSDCFKDLCQYPLADPTISAFLSHSWPVIHLVVFFFFISGQGYFTFLYGDAKHNREGGRKEQTNKHGLGSAPSARVGWSVTLFCASCELTRACTRAKTLTKPLAKLTSVDWSPLCPTLISLLTCSINWSLLLHSAASFSWTLSSCRLTSGAFLPSSFSLVGDLAHKPFVWVSRQNRQFLTGTNTHTHTTNAQHRHRFVYGFYCYFNI